MKYLIISIFVLFLSGSIQANQRINYLVDCNLSESQSSDKHFKKGMKLMESKKYEEAIKEFNKAIKSDSENGEFHKYRGIAKAELVGQCSIYNAKRKEGTPEKKAAYSKDSAKKDLKKAKELGSETDKETLFMLGIKPSEL